MRFLLATIGYAAVATLLSLALGLGYLWQTERLTDEKAFQVVALLHGVDLNEAIDATDEGFAETPDEEPSLAEAERLREIALRNHEALNVGLQRSKAEFDRAFSRLTEETTRFDELARELQQRLEQESEANSNEGVRKVVRDLKAARADDAKALLLMTLNEGGADPEAKQRAIDKVIRIINALPAQTWSDILRRFQDAELVQLHAIQERQLEGGPKQRVLDEAMRQLNDRNIGL